MIHNVSNADRNDHQNQDDEQLKSGTGEAGTTDTDDEEVFENHNDDLGDLDPDADMEDDDPALDEDDELSTGDQPEGTP